MIGPNKLLGETEYEFIRNLVYQHSRINLGGDKFHMVAQRIQKRLRALGLQDYGEYIKLLKTAAGADELTNLVDVISTNVTSFFREPPHFEFLRSTVLPEWHAGAKKTGGTFRIWSAACSSGEEPYSLAIEVGEFFRQIASNAWEVTATDISTRILEKAQRAVYKEESVTVPTTEILRRYFLKGAKSSEGFYRVKPEIANRVRFYHVNLFQPTYPFNEKMNVIFCRNVMIYFDQKTQEQLIARLSAQLVPGGYLIVGHSESLVSIRHSLKSLQPSIYQRDDVSLQKLRSEVQSPVNSTIPA